jgi:hypothetical protein
MISESDFRLEEIGIDKVEAGMYVYASNSRGLKIRAWVHVVSKTNGRTDAIQFRDAGTVKIYAPHFADLRFYLVKD